MSRFAGRRRSHKLQHCSTEALDRDRLLQELDFDNRPLNFSLLVKPVYFTILFSCLCIVLASEWKEYSHMPRKPHYKSYVKDYNKSLAVHLKLLDYWNSRSEGEKLFIPIFLINLVVFAMWRMAHYQPYMLRLFCQTPANPNLCWPMVLSIFSHFSPFHFISNMYTLLSFTKAAAKKLSEEQFLCLYLTSGVVSSLVSYAYKIYLNQPGLSLGASGAVMGILGFVCAEFPRTSVGIIYVPFYAIPSSQAVKVILTLNVIGMITGGSCDYAAHLGGIIYGIMWSKWGTYLI